MQSGSPLIAKTPRELETIARDSRIFIDRIRREGVILDADQAVTTPLRDGDTLAIMGRRELLVERVDGQRLGVR